MIYLGRVIQMLVLRNECLLLVKWIELCLHHLLVVSTSFRHLGRTKIPFRLTRNSTIVYQSWFTRHNESELLVEERKQEIVFCRCDKRAVVWVRDGVWLTRLSTKEGQRTE